MHTQKKTAQQADEKDRRIKPKELSLGFLDYRRTILLIGTHPPDFN
jgi:hypothetical protein